MRGIISYGAYVPYRRLQRSAIADVMGSGGGRGARSVASYDEDTTTMGVEAARLALSPVEIAPDQLWFSTTEPAYADKTNATAIHAALRLAGSAAAIDMVGSVRSAAGALRLAFESVGTTLVVASDQRGGLATGTDEANGGDAANALLIGESDSVLAELIGRATATDEFTDRWRVPGERHSQLWEDRFGLEMYLPLVEEAWAAALKDADLTADQVHVAAVSGLHARAVQKAGGSLGVGRVADGLADTVGLAGAAHPGLLLANELDQAAPGDVIALVVLSDGVEVLLFRTTDAIASFAAARSVADQIEARADLPYAKFLSWRGLLDVQPPNRPTPARVSSSAAHRRGEWKYAFVGSVDPAGTVHLPPARVSIRGGATDAMEPVHMADAKGTVITLTIDRLAYSPSPPIVFAIVDFEGGGRMPVELTDTDAGEVEIGDRVEMTFRKLFTSDGIHNYFWKARPARA